MLKHWVGKAKRPIFILFQIMTKVFLFVGTLLLNLPLLSQINTADSSAQAVAYWAKGDKQTYVVTDDKFKIKNGDTTSKERISYEVEISVLEAKEKSYTIQWLYSNFKTTSDNATMKKILGSTQSNKVIYKTDEMGSFFEVVNWKEIRDFIKKSTDLLAKDYSNIPEMDKLLKQIAQLYSSKEAIESSGIKDIQQFHTFHGGKYRLGEVVEGKIKVANIFGGEPFDATMQVYLDEMNVKENNYLLRSFQETDKEQLISATLDYLKKMSETLKIKAPTRDDVKDLKNELATASLIHDSGWNVYTIQTLTVSSNDITQVEERVIELK